MLRLLQRLYQKQINALPPLAPAPQSPDPDNPERQEAMRQAITAKARAEHIMRTLQEPKPAQES